jgi:hypothetical protein
LISGIKRFENLPPIMQFMNNLNIRQPHDSVAAKALIEDEWIVTCG